MKARLCSAVALVCLVLVAPAAFAVRIAGDVTATVYQIYDPSNLLGGQVSVDQTGRGRFKYDTDAPLVSSWRTWDGTLDVRSFSQSASQASLAFTLGDFVFETDATSPNWMFQVELWDSSPGGSNGDSIRLYGWPFKPVANLPGLGVNGTQVMFVFGDPATYRVLDYPMPTTFPDLDRFSSSTVTISGWNNDSTAFFEVRLMMQTAQPSVNGEFTVSPAAGAFVREQPIVPAVLLSAGTQILSIEGNVNGGELPAYFASCSPTGAVLKTVFVCPDLNNYLAPGINQVEWRVRLSDGSVTSNVVQWEIVQ